MKILNLVFATTFFISVSILAGCVSTRSADVFIDEKISGPKVIVVQGTRAPWAYEIEKRLKKRGFEIRRIASQRMAFEQSGPGRSIAYKEASARFLLTLDGHAPNDSINRCCGGGYNFDYIDAELIDLRKNETVLHYSNSGLSEGCAPMSGTIFGDIENLVSGAWK